ncbi:MAG: tyrosine recombinase XerD [Bacteroidales bacterium]|nr:tyrosine recombinase XerD [Bacteroidales bacterium]
MIFFEMTDNNLINYQSFLKFERNLTENSVEAYVSDVKKLQVFVGNKGKTLKDADSADIEDFLCGLHEVGISPSSQKRILVGIRSYYKFLRLEGKLDSDPTELIDSPKLGDQLPTVLSVEEVDRMISCADPSTCDGQRNRAILETLYSCGLRVSELTELKISNIFEKERYLLVFGKGRKERIVPISDSALREIHNYYEFRYELDVKPGYQDYVFLNRFGRKLSRMMVFNLVKRYAQEANVQKVISPHTFRHTFATHLLEGGANLRAIQLMLGHEQISTTEIYTKVDKQMLKEEILTYHPRNKRKK